MAYALCYVENESLVPIDLSQLDIDGKDLLKIVEYISLFDSKIDLLNELRMCGFVPKGDLKLVYGIRSSVKDKEGKNIPGVYEYKHYNVLANNIYYSDYKKCFNPDIVKNYLYENIKNVDFYNRFYYYLCCVFKLKNSICNYINDCISDPNKYSAFCSTIKKMGNSEVINIVSNLEPDHYPLYHNDLTKRLVELIDDPYFVIEFTKRFGSQLTAKGNAIANIPKFRTLNAIYGVAKVIRNDEEKNIPSSSETLRDFDDCFDEVWAAFALNDSLDLQTRNFCDLGMFVAHTEYEREKHHTDTLISRKQKKEFLTPSEIESLVYQSLVYKNSEEDENLTIEDFGNSLISAEEVAYRLRK